MAYNYLIKEINGDRKIVVLDEYSKNELLEQMFDDLFEESKDPWHLATSNGEYKYTVTRTNEW